MSSTSNASSRSYVVSVSSQGETRTQIWDSSAPLTLGHPFRYVIENGTQGVRVRKLPGGLGDIAKAEIHSVTAEMIAKGLEIKLPDPVTIRVRSVVEQKPAYEVGTGQGQIRAYTCAGRWVMDTQALTGTFVAKLRDKTIFTLTPSGENFTLKSEVEKIKSRELSRKELLENIINFDSITWRFDAATTPELSSTGPQVLGDDNAYFKKSLLGASALLAGVILLSILWPAPKDSELIPEQYAQIVLKPQPVKPAAPAEAAGASPQVVGAKEQPVNKKVEKAAVVQAFRAKALQNAVSGLLKGGMTQLLAQSDFVAGSSHAANARRILDTKSTALQATGQEVGAMNSRKVNVAALGGEAGGTAGGKGVGYGKGEHASVKGQGGGQVSLDLANSDVAEGLTKDEVGEVIHRHLSEVRYCYESAMLRTPDIEGKLLVAFTIANQGNVTTASVKQSTLPDPRLDDCIIRRLVTWKFPKTKGGIDVAVSYPFIFKTLGR